MRHLQRGGDQEGSFAVLANVAQPLGGDQEGFLGGVGGGIRAQTTAAQGTPDRRVVGREHLFEAGTIR